jgi:hypothetical protein
MLDYLTISKYAIESGYSEKAIRSKISEGVWQENHQWIKAPDGRNLIIIEGVNQWVEQGLASKQRLKVASKSFSCLKEKGAGRELNLSPLPLT